MITIAVNRQQARFEKKPFLSWNSVQMNAAND